MKTISDLIRLLESRKLLTDETDREEDRKDDRIRKQYENRRITWITCDSRNVVPGTVFLCKGAAFRPEYLEEAVEKGCIACMMDREMADKIDEDRGEREQRAALSGSGETGRPPRPDHQPPRPALRLPRSVLQLTVRDIRGAMAVIAADFFGYEPGRPVLTGITGTKGKTTTAWYLKGMLDAWEREKNGRETGLLSTVENYDGKQRVDSVMTTPEALTLHEHLANAKQSGLSYVTMEVSSQALKYKRVKELTFQVGIFLNISEDHISPAEHADFEDYFGSKLSIFRQTETACVNLDSERSGQILKAAGKAGRVVTFGRSPFADIRCREIHRENGKLVFRAECDRFSETFCLAMKGAFNVENAMAAIAAAYVYGVPVRCMKEALASVRVPGRMETFDSLDGKLCGIVDFAHNRLSFERLFDAVCQEYPQYGRVVSVFGCPGGKGLNRRRDLGLIAGIFSDKVYITTDDPMAENAQAIAKELKSYVETTGCVCECIEDREQAIHAAVSECGDEKTVILVLGKGSEKYQKIGGKAYRYPTDAEILGQAFREYDGWRRRFFPAGLRPEGGRSG